MPVADTQPEVAATTVLVYPPIWDTIDRPPLGPAVLAGALRQAGLPARFVDLNLAFHDWLLCDETLEGLLRGARPVDAAEEYVRLRELTETAEVARAAALPLRTAPLFFLARNLGMKERPLLGSQQFLAGITSSSIRLADLVGSDRDNPVKDFWDRWVSENVDRVLTHRPSLVAISVSHAGQLLPAIALARRLRDEAKRPRVFVGGPWSTFMTNSGTDLSPLFDLFDGIGVGPGEAVLVAAAESVPDLPEEMPGLWCAGSPRAPLGLTAPSSPDFSIFPLDRYFASGQPRFNLESSRGCWARCRFCNYPSLNRGYKMKPVDQVVAEVAEVQKRYPGAKIALADDTVVPRHALALAEAIGALAAEVGHRIEWEFCLRPDSRLDAEKCQALYAGGVFRVFIGFDAATDQMLLEIDKRSTLDQARTLVRNLRAAGIRIAGNIIVGLPGETDADRQATLDFREELQLDPQYVTTSLFALVRGSWYYDNMDEMGWPREWLDRVRENDVLTDFLPTPPVSRLRALPTSSPVSISAHDRDGR